MWSICEDKRMIISKPIPYEKNAFVLNEFDFGPRCHPKCANVNKPCSLSYCYKCNFCYEKHASCATYTCPDLYEPREQNEYLKCARSECMTKRDKDKCCQVII